MNSREKIRKIFERKSEGVTGFWTGSPHKDAAEIYMKKLNVPDREGIFKYLNDDCRHLSADRGYIHPQGKPMFDFYGGKEKVSHSQPGCFAECVDISEVEKYPWPNLDYLDFTEVLRDIRQHGDKFVLSGLWSPFFHRVADFFGMENYFV
ncbi:MAG: hypothetical protein WC637_14990, partial [Victivallales bacterium]